MKLSITSCLFLWILIVIHLAAAGEPEMETSRHIKMSIIQGKTVILPCMISFKNVEEKDRHRYSVKWTGKDSRIITVNERVYGNHRKFQLSHLYPNEWNLKVIRVRNTDSGEYKCQVNSEPVQAKTVVLVVHVAPRISSLKSVVVKETERLVIFCNVTGDPQPSVSWYKDNEKLEQYSGEMLRIETAARNNSGLYRCEAENGIDPADSEDIIVDVLYAPKVHLSTNRISQYRNKSIMLDCNVIANPKEKVTWYKNGKTLRENWKYKFEEFEQSDGSRVHNLDIGHVDRLDFGDYICLAVNSVGSASQIVTVTEITTRTIISNTESTTLKPDKNRETASTVTSPYTDGNGQTSSNRISLSSTSDSVHYIPDSSPRNGELVVVPENASEAICTSKTFIFVIVTLMYLFV